MRSNSSRLGLVHAAGPRRSRPRGSPRASRSSTPATAVRHAAVGIEQIGLDQRHAIARDPLEPLALALHDPGGRTASRRRAALAPRRSPSAPVPPATSTVMSGPPGAGATPSPWRLSRPRRSSTLAPSDGAADAHPQPSCFVRDLADGQEVDAVFVVRGPHAAPEAQRRGLPEAPARRRHGRGRGRRAGTASTSSSRCARAGARRARARAATRSTQRYGAAHHGPRAARPPSRASTTSPTCRRARPSRTTRWPPTCARWSPRSSTRTCASCSSAASTADSESGSAGARPRRPSTTTRPTATACSSTACRWPRACSALAGHLPGHRPRRRGHRRAAARHRQDRGLRLDRTARSS